MTDKASSLKKVWYPSFTVDTRAAHVFDTLFKTALKLKRGPPFFSLGTVSNVAIESITTELYTSSKHLGTL